MTDTSTVEVVIHQFRQILLYTFYFSGCQLIAFYYGLTANWTFLIFVILLGVSVFEDITYFDQDSHLPEVVVVLRIWANNVPLIFSETLIFILKRGHFMSTDPGPPQLIGRPQQMIVRIPTTGVEILDDAFLAFYYFLIYFFNFAFFRSVIAQLRLVVRMLKQNLHWTSHGSLILDQKVDHNHGGVTTILSQQHVPDVHDDH